jgi:hypothetical protein
VNDLLNAEEFYDYIVENYNLDRTSCRLIKNIISYVERQGFVDQEDNYRHLNRLMCGAFGLKEREIRKCHLG